MGKSLPIRREFDDSEYDYRSLSFDDSNSDFIDYAWEQPVVRRRKKRSKQDFYASNLDDDDSHDDFYSIMDTSHKITKNMIHHWR